MIIPNLSVRMLGGIQPEPMRRVAADTVDDGLDSAPVPDCPATRERWVWMSRTTASGKSMMTWSTACIA